MSDKQLIFFIIYAVGVIGCYFIMRKHVSKELGEWTVKDRVLTLIVSISSWIGILGSFLSAFMESDKFNGKAKW